MPLPKIPVSPGLKKVLRWVLLGVIGILLAALGLEVGNLDWDLGKLLGGSSWEEARVKRDIDGNIVQDGGKYTDEYNCEDFTDQGQAQKFFVNAGGPSEDTNRLDGDNDASACEHLNAGEAE